MYFCTVTATIISKVIDVSVRIKVKITELLHQNANLLLLVPVHLLLAPLRRLPEPPNCQITQTYCSKHSVQTNIQNC